MSYYDLDRDQEAVVKQTGTLAARRQQDVSYCSVVSETMIADTHVHTHTRTHCISLKQRRARKRFPLSDSK